jgi:hypothetical protein
VLLCCFGLNRAPPATRSAAQLRTALVDAGFRVTVIRHLIRTSPLLRRTPDGDYRLCGFDEICGAEIDAGWGAAPIGPSPARPPACDDLGRLIISSNCSNYVKGWNVEIQAGSRRGSCGDYGSSPVGQLGRGN